MTSQRSFRRRTSIDCRPSPSKASLSNPPLSCLLLKKSSLFCSSLPFSHVNFSSSFCQSKFSNIFRGFSSDFIFRLETLNQETHFPWVRKDSKGENTENPSTIVLKVRQSFGTKVKMLENFVSFSNTVFQFSSFSKLFSIFRTHFSVNLHNDF